MKFSVIVPSFNQENFIGHTLTNLLEIKVKAAAMSVDFEILLFDSESNKQVLAIIEQFRPLLDFVEIKKDLGQYDAINKGILKSTGDYWTWLNTDDLLDAEGFLKIAGILKLNSDIDYIYGNVEYINEQQQPIKTIKTWDLSFNQLVTKEPAIFQPGSWFKKSFTDKIGLLSAYECCFDYEYILRLLKNNAVFYRCDFPVSKFRYYAESKTGSKTIQFIKEQLVISKNYGRKWYNYLTPFSNLRLAKHFLIPRK